MLSTIRKLFCMAMLAAIGATLGALAGEPLFRGAATPPPRNVCMLFDVSGSMRQRLRSPDLPVGPTQLGALQDAAAEFVQRQDLVTDRLALATFASTAQIKARLGHDKTVLVREIERLAADGVTNLQAGLDAAHNVLRDVEGDRWILLFSDGKPESLDPREDAERPALQAAARAREQGIRLVAIGTGLADGEFLELVTGDADNVILSAPQRLHEAFARSEERIHSRQLLASSGDDADFGGTLVRAGAWASLIAIGMGLLMVAGQNRSLRRRGLAVRELLLIVCGGVLTGALSGAAGQAVFYLLADVAWLGAAGRVTAWLLLGLGAALGTSLFVPNLARRSAAAAGIAGGIAAAALFVFAVPRYGDSIGRLTSAAVLGALTGLALVVLEAVARRAWLVVHWSSKESSTLLLGDTPIVVGSGRESHVRTPDGTGLAPATFALAGGKVTLERPGQAARAVSNGESFAFGPLRVQVHLAADAASPSDFASPATPTTARRAAPKPTKAAGRGPRPAPRPPTTPSPARR